VSVCPKSDFVVLMKRNVWSLRTRSKGGGWGALFHRTFCGCCVFAGLCRCLFWEQMFHHICKHDCTSMHTKTLIITFTKAYH